MAPAVVNVFAVKDKANAMAKLNYSSIGGVAGGSASSSQSHSVELAEGEEIQLVLQIGNRKETSPVYKP